MREHLFTSESVTEGHPDKVCDQIADAVLDDILAHDPTARVACEVAANTGMVLVFGEISTRHYCDIPGIARKTIKRIGYDTCGFAADTCAVLSSIDEQSPDICQGVSLSLEARAGSDDPLDARGAGDQGLMFGFACAESEPYFPGTFMPLPAMLAHRLAQELAAARREHRIPGLGPDGKTQVTMRYGGFEPLGVTTVLISTQHLASVTQEALRAGLYEHVLRPIIPSRLCPGQDHAQLEFLTNPTGSFVKGGPEADSGLTGRKIIIDTYGGMALHGGGSFSGKDPSKVDRSASYYARYVAKNLVAAGVAERVELQVSYAIGRARPLSLYLNAFGMSSIPEERVEQMLLESGLFDFRPQAILNELNLLHTKYEPVAAYGHFGRSDLDLPWERLDKVDAIRQELK
jgi:S-adenosylmethionine synthetase